MKKKKSFPVIPVILLGILLALVLFVFCRPATSQMEFMSNYVFRNIKTYNWKLLNQSEDPVEVQMAELLGENQTQSAAKLHDYLKENTASLTWSVTAINPEEHTVTVHAEYYDGNSFLDAYSHQVAAWLSERLLSGELTLADVPDILTVLPDEENVSLISAAIDAADPQVRASSDITISFEKAHGLWLPNGYSDELLDAATCGLASQEPGLKSRMVSALLSELTNDVFSSLRSFDFGPLETLTGKEIPAFEGFENSPELYSAIMDTLADYASRMEYQVGDFDISAGEIPVTVKYYDASPIVDDFTTSIGSYALQHLLDNPVPDDATRAQLFRDCAAQADPEQTETTLVISYDPETGEISLPDTVLNVVTANLYSDLKDLSDLATSLHDFLG